MYCTDTALYSTLLCIYLEPLDWNSRGRNSTSPATFYFTVQIIFGAPSYKTLWSAVRVVQLESWAVQNSFLQVVRSIVVV